MDKRLDTVVDILKAVGEDTSIFVRVDRLAKSLPDVTSAELAGHLLMMQDAGLVELRMLDGGWNLPEEQLVDQVRLTWAGSDFMARAKDPKVVAMARRAAGTAFEALGIHALKLLFDRVTEMIANGGG